MNQRLFWIPTRFRLNWTRWLLGGILAVGSGLRVWGIGWGLPYLYHPDEFQVVQVYLKMAQQRVLNPHYFIYPALVMDVNALVYGVYFLIRHALGQFHSVADVAFPQMLILGTGIISDPNIYLIGRTVSILAGVGVIWLVFITAKKISGGKPAAGLIASAFTAFSFINVVQSRLILPNIFVALFVITTIWFSILLFERGQWKDYLFAGVAAGLAASAKYNGAVVLLVVVVSHFLKHGLTGWKSPKLVVAIVVSGLVFLVTNPYTLLDFQSFYPALVRAGEDYALGLPGVEGGSLLWYASYLLRYEGLAFFTSLLWVIFVVWKRYKPGLIVSFFPVAYFAFISSFAYHNDHTLLHMLPAIHVMGGAGIALILDKLFSLSIAKWETRLAGSVILAVSFAIPLIWTIPSCISTVQKNSRETGRVWIEQNLPKGSRIAIEAYSPYIDPANYVVIPVLSLVPFPLSWYEANKVNYVIFSEGVFGRYYRDPEKYKDIIQLYEDLFTHMDAVKFLDDGNYLIKIYRLKAPAAANP